MEDYQVPRAPIVPVPEPFMSPREVRRMYDAQPRRSPLRERAPGGGGRVHVVFPSPDYVPHLPEDSPPRNPRVAHPNREGALVLALRRSIALIERLPAPLAAEVGHELNVRATRRPHTNKFFGAIKCMLDVVGKMCEDERAAVLESSFETMDSAWQHYASECGVLLEVGVNVHDEEWTVAVEMRIGCMAFGHYMDIVVKNIDKEMLKDAFNYSLLEGNLGVRGGAMPICQPDFDNEAAKVGTFMSIENYGDERKFAINTFTNTGDRTESVWSLQIGQAVIVALMRIREQWDRVEVPANM